MEIDDEWHSKFTPEERADMCMATGGISELVLNDIKNKGEIMKEHNLEDAYYMAILENTSYDMRKAFEGMKASDFVIKPLEVTGDDNTCINQPRMSIDKLEDIKINARESILNSRPDAQEIISDIYSRFRMSFGRIHDVEEAHEMALYIETGLERDMGDDGIIWRWEYETQKSLDYIRFSMYKDVAHENAINEDAYRDKINSHHIEFYSEDFFKDTRTSLLNLSPENLRFIDDSIITDDISKCAVSDSRISDIELAETLAISEDSRRKLEGLSSSFETKGRVSAHIHYQNIKWGLDFIALIFGIAIGALASYLVWWVA